jgi:hypothetical protein
MKPTQQLTRAITNFFVKEHKKWNNKERLANNLHLIFKVDKEFVYDIMILLCQVDNVEIGEEVNRIQVIELKSIRWRKPAITEKSVNPIGSVEGSDKIKPRKTRI